MYLVLESRLNWEISLVTYTHFSSDPNRIILLLLRHFFFSNNLGDHQDPHRPRKYSCQTIWPSTILSGRSRIYLTQVNVFCLLFMRQRWPKLNLVLTDNHRVVPRKKWEGPSFRVFVFPIQKIWGTFITRLNPRRLLSVNVLFHLLFRDNNETSITRPCPSDRLSSRLQNGHWKPPDGLLVDESTKSVDSVHYFQGTLRTEWTKGLMNTVKGTKRTECYKTFGI